MVRDAAKTGSVDERSSEIAARALEFGDVMVAEVMIRRDRIAAIPKGASPQQLQRMVLEQGHSRMPVFDGELDRIIGYVIARDVLALAWDSHPIKVDDVVRPLLTVSLNAHISAVLREMQVKRVQIAIVVDDHGATAGLVTIEDLVEELVGDIFGEHDFPEEAVRVEPDGSAVVSGWVATRKVNRTLHIDLPIGRETMTVAGVCIALALAIPAIGSKLRVPDGTTLEIIDRIRSIRVHRHNESQLSTRKSQ